MTVRNVFIISPSKRVELIFSYPAFIGRNFSEILRVVDALQLSAKYQVATPVNWQPGDDTVVLPFISDEEAERIFGPEGGFRKVRSYCATCAIRRCVVYWFPKPMQHRACVRQLIRPISTPEQKIHRLADADIVENGNEGGTRICSTI